MRYYGLIHRWHDDKGYGFIKRKDTDDELFFHISDCPAGAQRPQVGWVVSFEIGLSRKGKVAACNIQSTQFRPRPTPLAAQQSGTKPPTARKQWLVFALLGLVVAYGYWRFQPPYHDNAALSSPQPPAMTASRPPAAESFSCDSRIYCSDMRSLAEARYFLQHCPGVKLDGDGDGEPCERQFAQSTH